MSGGAQSATKLTILGRSAHLVHHLGRGAVGEVFLAETASGERFVLKFARDRAAFGRLADEGARLCAIDSRFCVRLLGAGRASNELAFDGKPPVRLARGTPFLVLAHSEGSALTFDPAEPEATREARALVVARDIGRALADLHAFGVAHGDVKPDNILLESSALGSSARLMDFGLAGAADDPVARGGTRRYLAPEALESAGSGDARSRDLFALGVTLTELLCGRPAAGDVTPDALLKACPDSGLKSVARALLSPAPAARPSAEWVVARAFDLLGERELEDERRERRLGIVRRTYLALRRGEILQATRDSGSQVLLDDPLRTWVSEALELVRSVEELRGAPAGPGPVTIADLGSVGRARWLVAIVGAPAAAWPELDVATDSELASRLIERLERVEPASLTFGDLEGTVAEQSSGRPLDVFELALALGRGAPSQATLLAAEQHVRSGSAPHALTLATARALRLRGQLGRALSILEGLSSAAARIETAEILRRAGDPAGASSALASLDGNTLSPELAALVSAVEARLLLDAGDARGALVRLGPEPRGAFALEITALAEIALGERKRARQTLERALLVSETEEERARVVATSGNLAHYDGQAELALAHFRRAAEHAARAGAVLEEATYLTGVAAEATHTGELGAAVHAGRRAMLLFESLGRGRDAARALLSLAAVQASVGAKVEARELATLAAQRARAAGDRRCRAYAHLALSDVVDDEDSEGVEHARFAASLIDEADADDRLRVAARLLERGESPPVDALDALANATERALDARLEWWGARARVLLRANGPSPSRAVIDALLGFGEAGAPSVVRGPAFAAGAELARREGDGDAVRRLTRLAADAARELVSRAGPELASAVRLLPWVRAADASPSNGFAPEQLLDVDRLIRALGRRDRLRPLLEQVLDALVLWTGVERGLLLLRAPGGKLRPRAARNLLRSDLSGQQLELSSSLAERALEQGEPVVAVDATGDLPELHESVHALKLRSVLAVPLIARGEALGVVYLDDRVRRGAFGPRELSWVRLVATLAGLAIADARDQILLRRAARRARRAETRLAAELARREVELEVAERELARARDSRETRFRYDEIVGQSEALRSMLKIVDRVASSDVPVLLMGESGSGKELVARAIHRNGPRSARPFVAENCGAIPEPLLESTLFGHVRGAFTGAAKPRAGLFEVADSGSLFLDEIGEMSLGMQAKLLRALQDGEIRPVGSDRSRRVDVRVMGATHRDLEALVRAGRFREDLYYRLNVISVRIPSLRERIGDVPLLVKHFVARYAGERHVQFSKAAMDRLAAYAWPGNIRQLENEVRRALVLSDGVITPEHLTAEVNGRGATKAADELNLRQRVDALEAELVRLALRRTDGNQTRAAELLGVSRFGLQKMMKRLEISLESLS